LTDPSRPAGTPHPPATPASASSPRRTMAGTYTSADRLLEIDLRKQAAPYLFATSCKPVVNQMRGADDLIRRAQHDRLAGIRDSQSSGGASWKPATEFSHARMCVGRFARLSAHKQGHDHKRPGTRDSLRLGRLIETMRAIGCDRFELIVCTTDYVDVPMVGSSRLALARHSGHTTWCPVQTRRLESGR